MAAIVFCSKANQRTEIGPLICIYYCFDLRFLYGDDTPVAIGVRIMVNVWHIYQGRPTDTSNGKCDAAAVFISPLTTD